VRRSGASVMVVHMAVSRPRRHDDLWSLFVSIDSTSTIDASNRFGGIILCAGEIETSIIESVRSKHLNSPGVQNRYYQKKGRVSQFFELFAGVSKETEDFRHSVAGQAEVVIQINASSIEERLDTDLKPVFRVQIVSNSNITIPHF